MVATPYSSAGVRTQTLSPSVWPGSRFPVFLLLAAVIAGFFRTNSGFVIAAAMGSVVAVAFAVLSVFRLRQFRLSWILADGLLLGYSLGTLNTCVQLAFSGSTAAEYFFRTQEELSIALTTSLLASSLLFLVGGIAEKPIRINPANLSRRDLRFVWLGLIMVAAAFATGGIGFMGTVADDQHRVTILGEISGFVGTTLPAVTVFLFPKFRSGFSRIVCWVLLAVSLVALVPQGRRDLLYAVLLAFVAFGFTGHNRRSIWKSLLLAGVAIPFLYIGNIVFYAMRVTAWQGGTTRLNITELIGGANRIIRGGHDASFDQQVDENLRDRTFVLRYFSDLLDASWTHRPLYGGDLLFCVKSAIPAALYPNKEDVRRIEMEENLVNPEFGLFPADEANSILTTGVSDFGVLGIFIYPLGIAFLMNWFLRGLVRRLPEIVRVIVVVATLDILWQTEVSTGLYLVLARDLVFLSIPMIIVKLWEQSGSNPRRVRFEPRMAALRGRSRFGSGAIFRSPSSIRHARSESVPFNRS